MIRYGLKLWSQNDPSLFTEAIRLYKKGVFNFLELYINPGSFDKNNFEKLREIPITIHATHELHGLNLAHSNQRNTKILEEVFCFADFLNANYIVLHPGSGGDLQTTMNHLGTIKDPRVLIENMPYRVMPVLGSETCNGASIEEMQGFKNLGFGMCLDVGHAVAASVAYRIPYKKYVEKLLALSPFYFHVSDGNIDLDYDEHKDLGEGKIDYAWIKSQLQKLEEAWVVFETPKKGIGLENDLKNREYFEKL